MWLGFDYFFFFLWIICFFYFVWLIVFYWMSDTIKFAMLVPGWFYITLNGEIFFLHLLRCNWHMCVCAQSCPTLCDPMDCIVFQAPLFMRFLRQKYWSGLPFLTPEDLPNPGIEPASLVSLTLAGRFFTTAPPGKQLTYNVV